MIDDILNKFIKYSIIKKFKKSKKRLKTVPVYQTNCHKILIVLFCVNEVIIQRLWVDYLQKKYQSDNTNKIIVSQGFGGNTYSINSMMIYIINDKI